MLLFSNLASWRVHSSIHELELYRPIYLCDVEVSYLDNL